MRKSCKITLALGTPPPNQWPPLVSGGWGIRSRVTTPVYWYSFVERVSSVKHVSILQK